MFRGFYYVLCYYTPLNNAVVNKGTAVIESLGPRARLPGAQRITGHERVEVVQPVLDAQRPSEHHEDRLVQVTVLGVALTLQGSNTSNDNNDEIDK